LCLAKTICIRPVVLTFTRPATQDDVKGITDIYNHYVLSPHSIITEDQKAVSADDVAFLIKHTRGEKYPFIVAVKGRMPVGKSKNAKSTLPQFETIIGFGYAETYNNTIGGGMNGRSRFTKNIQFYVHPEYTGKKVGRSILDRLIKSLSHGYG
jgi:GNAT superfamily N-acetyltransferase